MGFMYMAYRGIESLKMGPKSLVATWVARTCSNESAGPRSGVACGRRARKIQNALKMTTHKIYGEGEVDYGI